MVVRWAARWAAAQAHVGERALDEHDVGRLYGHIRAAADRDAHVGLSRGSRGRAACMQCAGCMCMRAGCMCMCRMQVACRLHAGCICRVHEGA